MRAFYLVLLLTFLFTFPKFTPEEYAKMKEHPAIGAHIVKEALPDVFDALVSKRCYKEAVSFDRAFSIIAQDAGTHFDPELASVLLRCRPQLEHFYQEQENDYEQIAVMELD